MRDGGPGIGHNSGTLPEPGAGGRRFAWKMARQQLLKNKVPLEIVRIRVRRAQQLGLSYPQYASILLGGGRDIVGFLFTVDGLQLRLRRRLELPGTVADKLASIDAASLRALSPAEEAADGFLAELEEVSGARFAAAASQPWPEDSWRAARAAVRTALDGGRIAGAAVVMVGSGETQRAWATAGKLAAFLPSEAYFQRKAG